MVNAGHRLEASEKDSINSIILVRRIRYRVEAFRCSLSSINSQFDYIWELTQPYTFEQQRWVSGFRFFGYWLQLGAKAGCEIVIFKSIKRIKKKKKRSLCSGKNPQVCVIGTYNEAVSEMSIVCKIKNKSTINRLIILLNFFLFFHFKSNYNRKLYLHQFTHIMMKRIETKLLHLALVFCIQNILNENLL